MLMFFLQSKIVKIVNFLRLHYCFDPFRQQNENAFHKNRAPTPQTLAFVFNFRSSVKHLLRNYLRAVSKYQQNKPTFDLHRSFMRFSFPENSLTTDNIKIKSTRHCKTNIFFTLLKG